MLQVVQFVGNVLVTVVLYQDGNRLVLTNVRPGSGQLAAAILDLRLEQTGTGFLLWRQFHFLRWRFRFFIFRWHNRVVLSRRRRRQCAIGRLFFARTTSIFLSSLSTNLNTNLWFLGFAL